jgi:hypothetical protein
MALYITDRQFTDYVHQHLAIKKIYNVIGWGLVDVDKAQALQQDIAHGIDYTLKNKEGKIIRVQERFREKKYCHYNDATLRFRRDLNPNPERAESEFYKIKADYLVYGITDGNKEDLATINGFLKGVIIDIQYLQEKFKTGALVIGATGTVRCKRKGDTMICPENFNPDGSSSFLPFDVLIMKSLWGTAPILYQKGFY